MYPNRSLSATDKSKTSILSEPVGQDHSYEVLAKRVKVPDDMRLWERSLAYKEYTGFILALNDEVRGISNSDGCQHLSEQIEAICVVLDKLSAMIDEFPAIQQPQRFGNIAFRTWYEKLSERAFCYLKDAFPDDFHRAIPEIMYYLIDGFGNSTRIDYGTGHEISFIMFLYCLFRIGFFTEQDKCGTVCSVFVKYLDVVRKLQQTYRMEPAGSHGVWSLDDYQFVPFIWGSSQLIGHPKIDPPAFLKEKIIEQHASDYLFLGCVQYINKVKTGPFAEHSNQLWGISGVSTWQKINAGLIRMYKVEVLGKFPVVQHILFGSLLPLKSDNIPGAECTDKKKSSTSTTTESEKGETKG